MKSSDSTAKGTCYVMIRTHDNNYFGDAIQPSTAYVEYTKEWTTNPNTGNAWTWNEIDALEIGIKAKSSRKQMFGMWWYYYPIQCTQVWVVINYTPQ